MSNVGEPSNQAAPHIALRNQVSYLEAKIEEVTKVSKEILSTFKQYEKINAKQREQTMSFLTSLAQYESLTTPFANKESNTNTNAGASTNANHGTNENDAQPGSVDHATHPSPPLSTSQQSSHLANSQDRSSKRMAAVAREAEAFGAECASEFSKVLQPLANWRSGLLQEVLETKKTFDIVLKEFDINTEKFIHRKEKSDLSKALKINRDLAESEKKLDQQTVLYVMKMKECLEAGEQVCATLLQCYISMKTNVALHTLEVMSATLPSQFTKMPAMRRGISPKKKAHTLFETTATGKPFAKAMSSPAKRGGGFPDREYHSHTALEAKEMQAVHNLQTSLFSAQGAASSQSSLLAHSQQMVMQAVPSSQPAITKSGYLEVKQEKKSNWKQRWVQIDDGQLMYFKNYKDSRPLDTYALLLCSVRTNIAAETAGKHENVFQLINNTGKTVTFSASEFYVFQEWLAVIRNSITTCITEQQDNTPSANSAANSHGDVGAQSEETLALMHRLRTVHGNDVCADCNQREPLWCSINIGVLLCLQCSGVHRSLGAHISKVQSLTLDVVPSLTLMYLTYYGNAHANRVLESKLANTPKREGYIKPSENSSSDIRYDFIRYKYIDHLYSTTTLISISEFTQAQQARFDFQHFYALIITKTFSLTELSDTDMKDFLALMRKMTEIGTGIDQSLPVLAALELVVHNSTHPLNHELVDIILQFCRPLDLTPSPLAHFQSIMVVGTKSAHFQIAAHHSSLDRHGDKVLKHRPVKRDLSFDPYALLDESNNKSPKNNHNALKRSFSVPPLSELPHVSHIPDDLQPPSPRTYYQKAAMLRERKRERNRSEASAQSIFANLSPEKERRERPDGVISIDSAQTTSDSESGAEKEAVAEKKPNKHHVPPLDVNAITKKDVPRTPKSAAFSKFADSPRSPRQTETATDGTEVRSPRGVFLGSNRTNSRTEEGGVREHRLALTRQLSVSLEATAMHSISHAQPNNNINHGLEKGDEETGAGAGK